MIPSHPTQLEISPLGSVASGHSGGDLNGTSNLPSCFYSASSPLDFSKSAEMTTSTVVMEKHITQREARMLKTLNKELRVKIQKLSEILDRKKVEIDGLVQTVSECERNVLEAEDRNKRFEEVEKDLMESISSLERRLAEQNEREKEQKRRILSLQKDLEKSENDQRKTESDRKLLAEKNSLEEKVKQLLQENKTMFERSTNLLTQLQDSETKREVERSEKRVLQGKIDYLGAELRRIKLSRTQGGTESEQQSVYHGIESNDVKQQHSFASAHTSTNSRFLNSQHQHPSKGEIGLRKTDNSFPVATSNGRPRELPLRATATPFQPSGRYGQPLRSQGEQKTSDGRNPYRKQDMAVSGHQTAIASHEQEISKSAARRHGVGKTLEGGFGGRSRVEGVAVGRASQGVLAPGVTTVECPICNKKFSSSGKNYEVLLHVEQCIQHSESTT
jgi:hypothetical protein